MSEPWDRIAEDFRAYLLEAGYNASDFNSSTFDRAGVLSKFKEMNQKLLQLQAKNEGAGQQQLQPASKFLSLVPELYGKEPPELNDIGAGTTTGNLVEAETKSVVQPDAADDQAMAAAGADKDEAGTKKPSVGDTDADDEGDESKIDYESGSDDRKREREEGDPWEGNKRRKYWKATKMPATVPSTNPWYQGLEGSELFIRQCTLDCFRIIWERVEHMREKDPNRCIAFIVTGPPGVGKSWSSNAIVWLLLKQRQNFWFHSASEETVTKIEFKAPGQKPDVSVMRDVNIPHAKPEKGTWFLYDSVRGSVETGSKKPFAAQQPGIPCVIFSSPKAINCKLGIRQMETGPGGGSVWELWMPSWEWEELEAVMDSLHRESGGDSQKEDFRNFIQGLYQLWGGIPRRFNKYRQEFRDNGKHAALAQSRNEFKNELHSLSESLIRGGPVVKHTMLDDVGREGDKKSKKTAPPSWLIFPLPVDSVDGPFRCKSYKFCSREAEVEFWTYLEGQGADEVRKFCKRVFSVSGVAGIALNFERFAHFVLTRTDENKFQRASYLDKNRKVQELELPRCISVKCDVKNDMAAFQEVIATHIKAEKNVVIDPESDQQDAIDMFVVCKLDGEWYVLAIQDTISKSHSFHPVKILEYKTSAMAAFKKTGVQDVRENFFQHVVVVPNQKTTSPFRLENATMPKLKLDNMELVRAKFEEIGLEIPPALVPQDTRRPPQARRSRKAHAKKAHRFSKKAATGACRNAGIKDGEELFTAGARALLVEAAKEQVERLTWVLDGFFTG